MKLSEYGLYGLGVMGQSLAKNIVKHNYSLSVYNYESEVTNKFEKDNHFEKLKGFNELKLFVESLKKPRKVIIIVTAGSATESVIDQLLGFLEEGDSILNFANTFFKDSNRYNEKAKLKMQNDRAKFKNLFSKAFSYSVTLSASEESHLCILNCNFNFLSLIFDIC